MTDNVLLFKQELKKLKKRVKQMEAQRNTNRSWNHKAELLDMKKQKLKMKEILFSSPPTRIKRLDLKEKSL